MKPNQAPTHLSVVFASNRHMRREHVAGAPLANEGEPATIVIGKGEEKRITRLEALDLITSGCGVDASKADNKPRIAEIRAEVEADSKRRLKKAA